MSFSHVFPSKMMIFHSCVSLPEPPNGRFKVEDPWESIYKWMIWRYPYSRNSPPIFFLYVRPRKIRWLEKAVSESMLGILQRRGYFSRITFDGDILCNMIYWYTDQSFECFMDSTLAGLNLFSAAEVWSEAAPCWRGGLLDTDVADAHAEACRGGWAVFSGAAAFGITTVKLCKINRKFMGTSISSMDFLYERAPNPSGWLSNFSLSNFIHVLSR